MHSDPSSVMKVRLHDVDNSSEHHDIELEIESHGIAIRPVGYGDKVTVNGHGSPLFIEFRNGIPMIIIWDDINNEEPSHLISLEKAAESSRREKRITTAIEECITVSFSTERRADRL